MEYHFEGASGRRYAGTLQRSFERLCGIRQQAFNTRMNDYSIYDYNMRLWQNS
jgi:hypothetical protein